MAASCYILLFTLPLKGIRVPGIEKASEFHMPASPDDSFTLSLRACLIRTPDTARPGVWGLPFRTPQPETSVACGSKHGEW